MWQSSILFWETTVHFEWVSEGSPCTGTVWKCCRHWIHRRAHDNMTERQVALLRSIDLLWRYVTGFTRIRPQVGPSPETHLSHILFIFLGTHFISGFHRYQPSLRQYAPPSFWKFVVQNLKAYSSVTFLNNGGHCARYSANTNQNGTHKKWCDFSWRVSVGIPASFQFGQFMMGRRKLAVPPPRPMASLVIRVSWWFLLVIGATFYINVKRSAKCLPSVQRFAIFI